MVTTLKVGKIALLAVMAVLMVLFCSCTSFKKGDTTVLLKVGGKEVTAEMYRYVCMKNMVYLFDGIEGKDLSNAQKEELSDAVLSELRKYFAIETLAEKYKVNLSKSDRKTIKSEIKENRKNYEDEEEYFAQLESMYMSENVFYQQTLNYYLERDLFRFLTDEASDVIRLSDKMLLEDVENHFYAVVQIYLSDKSKTKTMEALKKRADAGEDFFELAEEFSEDSNKGMRYFTEGEMYESLEKAVETLEIGEISGVIESEIGLHLLMRCALDAEYIDEHLEEFRETDLVRIYNEMCAKEAEGLTVEYTEDYNGLILE